MNSIAVLLLSRVRLFNIIDDLVKNVVWASVDALRALRRSNIQESVLAHSFRSRLIGFISCNELFGELQVLDLDFVGETTSAS